MMKMLKGKKKENQKKKKKKQKKIHRSWKKKGRQAGKQAVTLHSTSARVARSLVFFTHRPAGALGTVEFFFFFFFYLFFFFVFFFPVFFFLLLLLVLFASFLSLSHYSLSAYPLIPCQSVPAHSRSHTHKHAQHIHTYTHTHTHSKGKRDAISVIITGDVTPRVAQFQNPAQELRVLWRGIVGRIESKKKKKWARSDRCLPLISPL